MAGTPNRDDDLIDGVEATIVVGLDAPAPSIDDLVEKRDAESLVALGLAHYAGTPHVTRDLGLALESFSAAASLGHAEAERIVGLAHFRGVGIPQDQAKGAAHLRTAAQNGSLRAKVLVANLYEMGIHYAADAEKADVWYRNVARAAGIEAAPDSHDYLVEMAALGCVRDCLKLVANESLPSKDRASWLKKAKSMGYAPGRASTTPAEPSGSRAASLPSSSGSSAAGSSSGAATTTTVTPSAEHRAGVDSTASASSKPDEDGPLAKRSKTADDNHGDSKAKPDSQPKTESRAKTDSQPKGESTPNRAAKSDSTPEPDVLLGAQWTIVPGVLAWLAASFFAITAFLAGSLAVVGARSLASTGTPLPLIGTRFEVVLLVISAVLGVFPAAPLYRGRVFLVGALLAAAAGAGGWFLFDVQPWLWNRGAQSAVFALGGFLALLLIGGVIGGTRARPPPPKETLKVSDPIRLMPPR